MESISARMARHHERCDGLFAAAETELSDAGPLAMFREELERHLACEESVLFPAFERATGMLDGPTAVMRGEHARMRALLDRLAAARQGGDADGYAGLADTLFVLMQQHDRKEEDILYPMCDRALAHDLDEIGARIDAAVEVPCRP
jgi:iron-sulfur cluster repair protein YtfE (RIC family)